MNLRHHASLTAAHLLLLMPVVAVANDGMGGVVRGYISGALLLAGAVAFITFVVLLKRGKAGGGVNPVAGAVLAFVLAVLALWLLIFTMFQLHG